jgi:hypothetical protein
VGFVLGAILIAAVSRLTQSLWRGRMIMFFDFARSAVSHQQTGLWFLNVSNDRLWRTGVIQAVWPSDGFSSHCWNSNWDTTGLSDNVKAGISALASLKPWVLFAYWLL